MNISKVVKKYPSGKIQSVEYRVNGLLHNPTYVMVNEDDYLRVPKIDENQVVPGHRPIFGKTTYYESGRIESFTDYYQNKKHGIMEWYYESGHMSHKSYWFNNGLHRESLNGAPRPAMTEWFESGEIKSLSYWTKDIYSPGVKVNNEYPFFIEYNIKGKITKMAYYDKNGKITNKFDFL